MRLNVILFSLLMIVSASQAQSDLPYQLRVPTAEEYIAAMPALLYQSETDYYRNEDQPQVVEFKEIVWQQLMDYGIPLEDYSYDVISTLYLPYTNDRYLISSPFSHVEELNTALIQAWLRENPINLDTFDANHPLQIGPNTITVIPRDFNGDGQHEWILDVKQDVLYARKEVVMHMGDGHYQLIETPLPWFGCCTAYRPTWSGLDEEIAFEDLNQDGLPEWVIAIGEINSKNHGFLYILQWQDGRLVDLTENGRIVYIASAENGSPRFPHGGTVTLKDVDGNGTIDIQFVQKQEYDNWGCTWTQTQNYGWQESRYGLLEETREYDPVIGCAWREAETAMWQHDYDTAITEYKRAATLPYVSSPTNDALHEYTRVRLALAYVLSHRPEDARNTLQDLTAGGITSTTVQQMASLLVQMIETASDAEICQAMYDVWQGYVDTAKELYEGYTQQYPNEPIYVNYRDVIDLDEAYVGYIKENDPTPNYHGLPIPQPEKAGCDISFYGGQISEQGYGFRALPQAPPMTMATPGVDLVHTIPLGWGNVWNAYYQHQTARFLVLSRFYMMQIQQGIATGDEWEARYLFATALRLNNRPDEALEQYVYLYEHSTRESWRQLAGLYLTPIAPQTPGIKTEQ
jgi:hypothetical protein